jgi:transposase
MREGVAMRFAELSDEQREFIKPHIPPQPIVGRKRADDRKIINGILYVLITGCRWHDMPRRYGAYQAALRRLKWWSKEGVWTKILAAAQEQAYVINIGRGRPKTEPGEVSEDAAYDTESIRCYLRRRGIKSSIPSNKRNEKKPSRGRPTRFDNASHKKTRSCWATLWMAQTRIQENFCEA